MAFAPAITRSCGVRSFASRSQSSLVSKGIIFLWTKIAEWGRGISFLNLEVRVPFGVIMPEILRGFPDNNSEMAETVVPPFRRILPSRRVLLTWASFRTPSAISLLASGDVKVNWIFMVSPSFLKKIIRKTKKDGKELGGGKRALLTKYEPVTLNFLI
jgi:hypothetical protein